MQNEVRLRAQEDWEFLKIRQGETLDMFVQRFRDVLSKAIIEGEVHLTVEQTAKSFLRKAQLQPHIVNLLLGKFKGELPRTTPELEEMFGHLKKAGRQLDQHPYNLGYELFGGRSQFTNIISTFFAGTHGAFEPAASQGYESAAGSYSGNGSSYWPQPAYAGTPAASSWWDHLQHCHMTLR
jgi:hypothetical protein